MIFWVVSWNVFKLDFILFCLFAKMFFMFCSISFNVIEFLFCDTADIFYTLEFYITDSHYAAHTCVCIFTYNSHGYSMISYLRLFRIGLHVGWSEWLRNPSISSITADKWTVIFVMHVLLYLYTVYSYISLTAGSLLCIIDVLYSIINIDSLVCYCSCKINMLKG